MPGFTGGTLDRADRLRHDAEALAAARGDWRARLLRLEGLEPSLDAEGRLEWGSLADAPEGAELVFLGFDARERPHFAAFVPGTRAPSARPMRLFGLVPLMAPGEAATYAAARSLLDWHGRHGFCANCGTPTIIVRAGWGRMCGSCQAEHFPRVDPVVIMLVEHQGRCLLGRQPGWPERRYSALAGFLEVGESIEEAVAREVFEEAGVRTTGVRYVASQPWPFPSSLMIACIADAENDVLTLDRHELEDAFWASRDEVRAALAGATDGRLLPPMPFAIAHTLLSVWAQG